MRACTVAAFIFLLSASCGGGKKESVTVPVTFDHNRMLVEAEVQRADGTWRTARLWVDTGNPSFYMSAALARDLGVDLAGATQNTEVPPPAVRIGGMPLDFQGVRSLVMFEPQWLFSAMHNDGNLPSTVLARYRVVFDYPKGRLTLAKPGRGAPRGSRSAAAINPRTGIVQIDAVIDGDSLSFALDNGASFSFVSGDVLARLSERHPDWPRMTGALGCANMWGWWPPGEEAAPLLRIPDIAWGAAHLAGVGIVVVSAVASGGPSLGEWYSQKTARRVDGFLGPNAFKSFRIEIDYANGAVYFEKGASPDAPDMDLVGLTLRPEPDGIYRVIGIAMKDGKPSVEGVEPGDVLMRIGDLEVKGATMGTIVDALRGKPGEIRKLVLGRNGAEVAVDARVERFM